MEVSNNSGCLYVVATPIGNLGDISGRAIEVLAGVDLVAAEDTRHSGRLLRHLGLECPMLALHEHNERERLDVILERLAQGQQIALVSDAGTPLISDPGYPLVRACHEAGFRVSPVPGASALVAALSVAGLPTDQFFFRGFVPRKESARRGLLAACEQVAATQVFYESSHRIADTLGAMCEHFGGRREAALCRELTKLHETVRLKPLRDLLELVQSDGNQRKGEFVLVVAGVPMAATVDDQALQQVLGVLLDENLPLKQVAAIAARLAGVKRNHAYRQALELVERKTR